MRNKKGQFIKGNDEGFKKGCVSFNKGKHLSEEHKKNIRISLTGKKLSKEHKKALRVPRKGAGIYKHKPHTEEWKEKQSKWMTGRKVSEKTRIKIAKSKIGKPRLDIAGEKHFNWKGGVTKERQRIQITIEYKQWRMKVFNRDKFTCRECGDDRGGNLQAHHIKSFAEYPELRFIVSNGITLCKECHKKTDNYLYKIRHKKQKILLAKKKSQN